MTVHNSVKTRAVPAIISLNSSATILISYDNKELSRCFVSVDSLSLLIAGLQCRWQPGTTLPSWYVLAIVEQGSLLLRSDFARVDFRRTTMSRTLLSTSIAAHKLISTNMF